MLDGPFGRRIKKKMKAQIYTPQMTRDLHIRQISEFTWPFFNKILPQFRNIDDESEQVADDYWQQVMAIPADESSMLDPSDFAEQARDRGIDHYMMMSLGLYTATLAWHATLFEFFHQQVRLFLYKEMEHDFKVELKKFCTNFSEIKDVFSSYKFDITTINSWGKIYELQILCNTIKHGDGDSLEKLRSIAPGRFKMQNDIDLFNLHKTTLLEITLDVNEGTLREYQDAVCDFWKKIPERCYTDEL
jgi:hypothetical protein